MGKSNPEQEYATYFKEHYAGISKTQRDWAMKCLDKGQFTTPYGLTFYFPDTKMSKSGHISNSTSIYNYPINKIVALQRNLH